MRPVLINEAFTFSAPFPGINVVKSERINPLIRGRLERLDTGCANRFEMLIKEF